VEVEALWYNALKIVEELLTLTGESAASDNIREKAELVKKSFEEKFWYAEGNYLYDVIDEKGNPDASLRPNQIFALSLPFHLIDGEKAKAVFEIILSKLFTPVGLRSLSPDDPDYSGHYGGSPFQRDAVYHQGTVWSWLLGPFVEAGMKFGGDAFKPEAFAIINRFASQLNESCIGNISEIFDGDTPHHPRGCVAQAWGVAEILRVIKTYSLFHAGS
jgi:glycogen debranching enzyme